MTLQVPRALASWLCVLQVGKTLTIPDMTKQYDSDMDRCEPKVPTKLVLQQGSAHPQGIHQPCLAHPAQYTISQSPRVLHSTGLPKVFRNFGQQGW